MEMTTLTAGRRVFYKVVQCSGRYQQNESKHSSPPIYVLRVDKRNYTAAALSKVVLYKYSQHSIKNIGKGSSPLTSDLGQK